MHQTCGYLSDSVSTIFLLFMNVCLINWLQNMILSKMRYDHEIKTLLLCVCWISSHRHHSGLEWTGALEIHDWRRDLECEGIFAPVETFFLPQGSYDCPMFFFFLLFSNLCSLLYLWFVVLEGAVDISMHLSWTDHTWCLAWWPQALAQGRMTLKILFLA